MDVTKDAINKNVDKLVKVKERILLLDKTGNIKSMITMVLSLSKELYLVWSN